MGKGGVRIPPTAPPSQVREGRRPRRSRGITRRTGVLIAVLLVAMVIGSVLLLVRLDPGILSPAPSQSRPPTPSNSTHYTVAISRIVYAASSCWSNLTGPGTTVSGGAQFATSLALKNTGIRTCVVNAASATTMGFSIPRENTPLSVPPGQSATLDLSIQTPNFDVDQALSVTLTVQVL
jgi:hypothetical protein